MSPQYAEWKRLHKSVWPMSYSICIYANKNMFKLNQTLGKIILYITKTIRIICMNIQESFF